MRQVSLIEDCRTLCHRIVVLFSQCQILCLGHQRSYVGVLVEGITDFLSCEETRECIYEFFFPTLFDDKTLQSVTHLSSIRESHIVKSIENRGNICISKDDAWSGSSEFEQ